MDREHSPQALEADETPFPPGTTLLLRRNGPYSALIQLKA